MKQSETIARLRELGEYISKGEESLRLARREQKQLLAVLLGTAKKEKKS
jgi:hypothetical protein